MIILELKRCTKQIVFIDDFWIGIRVPHPEFNESNDQGYHSGYSGAIRDPATNQHRAATVVKRRQGLMCKLCEMVHVIDYPWTELSGQSRPLAYNEQTLGLAQPRVSSIGGGFDPAASGMAGLDR